MNVHMLCSSVPFVELWFEEGGEIYRSPWVLFSRHDTGESVLDPFQM